MLVPPPLGVPFPVCFWEDHVAGAGATSPPVPANTTLLLTGLDVFYYGGSVSDDMTLSTFSTSILFFDWRPQTGNQQSKSQTMFQWFNYGEKISANCSGDFSFRLSGWYYPLL